jgi:hypothetical protein
MKKLAWLLVLVAALPACAVVPRADAPQAQFFQRLRSLCGNAYAGRVVTSDAADSEMASQPLVIHVRTCSDQEIRIPFQVGADRSRTWVISRTGAGLRLKHDHRHEDGSADAVTRYGGDTASPGSARRQEFPADEYSRELFVRQDIPASITNVWAVEIVPGQVLAYELRRPNRHFRVEFDLSRPVPAPPPPWSAR